MPFGKTNGGFVAFNVKKHKNTIFGIENLLDGFVENYIIKDKYILNFHAI
jgi:hypothetical protein